jgi:hypothetical protein
MGTHRYSLNDTIEPEATSTKSMPRLPCDVMENIVAYLDLSTLRSAMKTSRDLYALAVPLVYETIYLNRNTPPGLARWMNGEMMERKKELLAKVTTLVIDDIQVMFCFTYDEDLKKFCDSIVLPSVTRLIWRQDELRPVETDVIERSREPLQVRQGYSIFDFQDVAGPLCTDGSGSSAQGRWVSTEAPLPPFTPTVERPTRNGPRSSRVKEFSKVLPSAHKTICIQLPPSGVFQILGSPLIYHHSPGRSPHFLQVTDRIMGYLVKLSGDKTIRIHQPINPHHLTLAEVPGATTVYCFYPKSTNGSAKRHLVRAWQRTMGQRLRRLGPRWSGWTEIVVPAIKAVLYGKLKHHDMLKACLAIIRDSAMILTPQDSLVGTTEIVGVINMGVTEMVRALHPDQASTCHCCGDK